MRLILEAWKFRFELDFSFYWTTWYLPIHFQSRRGVDSFYLSVALFWLIALHFKIPMPISKKRGARLVSGNKYL